MSDIRIDPSELHWKKDLNVLRKAARLLRDPETSSSWRSPLSSRSVAATSSWNYLDGTTGNGIGSNHISGYSENGTHLAIRGVNNQKKVFLYNWRHQSGRSSDSGAKLGEDKFGQGGSVHRSPEDSLSDTQKEDSMSDTFLGDPIMVFRAKEASTVIPARRTVRRLKKNCTSSRQPISRNSKNSRRLDIPTISIGETLNSVEQSDDTEYCNSEDLQILTQKLGYTPRSASPWLPRCGNWSHSSKLLKSIRRDDSSYSYTPASTSSYKRDGKRNPSTVGSWDGTTASFNGDELDQFDLPRRQGCGIPCYWSKRAPKHRGCGGCYSPSLSDTLRRKGSSILCGSQTLYHRHRTSRSSKHKLVSRPSEGLALLTNSGDGRGCSAGSSIETGQSDDELSTNFGELDLEALSRLDGRRWSSSCRSQEGLELVALTGGAEEGTPDHIRSLSQKYRPRSFDEIIGQNIVVRSLINAISRGRIAPFYLFQGPHGTGKTSTARIFAAALNCREDPKPCGFCRECTDIISCKSRDLREVNATNRKEIDKVRSWLKDLCKNPASRFKVCVLDECHLLPSKTWSAFMKFLEEPPLRVVFIFITADLDSIPRTVLSRCQKYIFNKIKEADIVTRLKKLSADENLDVESDALELIALNAEGSLRDAETMLDQLSLLGKRINTSLVNELVGVVSDEKLLDLLELAMSSDTAETVKRARELMDSGVDPVALMSQLAGLIMDIIAGTYHLVDSKSSGSYFSGRSLTEAELERLKQALKLLSEAEKQLRLSSERSTWFTAALLQLGSAASSDPSHSSSSRRQSSKTTGEDPSGPSGEASTHKKQPDALRLAWKSTSSSASIPRAVNECSSSHEELLADHSSLESRAMHSRFMEACASGTSNEETAAGSRVFRCLSPDKLDAIWVRCIDKCPSKKLKQLLRVHGKLVAISEVEGVLIVSIAFVDGDIKSRAERFLGSITNSVRVVLRHNVEVRIGLLQDWENSVERLQPFQLTDSLTRPKHVETSERESKSDCGNLINGHADLDPYQELQKVRRETFNSSKDTQQGGKLDRCDLSESLTDRSFLATSGLPAFANNEGAGNCILEKQEIPMPRIQPISDEQLLETAWLQAEEKGTPGSVSRLKPERNQVLPQDSVYRQNQMTSMMLSLSSQRGDDELNHEIKASKINDNRSNLKNPNGRRIDHSAMSPSLLHDSSFPGNFNQENLGYESGSGPGGCNGLLCWKTSKHINKEKVKVGTPVRSRKGRNLLWFGQCRKSRKIENGFRR
ncbi:protein STICHEL isoform X1 [Telopea speciosissima]|uniref:protein STICHEL isoform X1 n=1 Tax=Telopea speciosissima TaxID=54955 RepID=UPI001CC36BD7|nr:protein STICHEL isoform X1 [Telopea speciosissima]